MKKTIAILLIIAMALSFTACSDKQESNSKANTEIDAAAISGKIVPPSYSLVEAESESSIWTSNYLTEYNGTVYYIGSDSWEYHICSFNPESASNKVIFSSDERTFWDVATSSKGLIFVLASPNSNDFTYEIIELDLNGNELGTYSLNKVSPREDWMPKQIECSDGKLFILSDNYLIATEVSSEIKVCKSIPVNSASGISHTSDGKIILSSFDVDNNFYLQLYSTENCELIQTVAFNMLFSGISGGKTWDVFLSDNNALYGYRFETNELQKLFSWNGIGLLRGSIIEVAGKLVCSGHVSYDKPSPLCILEPREVDQETSSVIRFATTDPAGIDFRVQDAIREWNNSNPNCPIEIIDYSVYGGSDKNASSVKLMADIIAGNMPDIYDFSMTAIDSIPSSAQFVRRGLLEDLYPYIDNDPELSREDFIPGVIRSLEISGGLYEVVPAFSLVTTFAASSAVGPEDGWTYDNFNSIIENSNYFDSIFDKHHDRMWLLGNIVDASGKKLVNWSEGECYFESNYFKNLLETVKTIPETGMDMGTPLLADEVAINTGLLYYINANDVWMASTGPQAFNEDYCFPGLPEVGSAIYPLCSYGISAYSPNKDQCWQFLRQFLTEEYKLKFFITPRMDGLMEQINNTWEGFGEIRQYHPYGLEAMNTLADIIININTVVRHDPQIWQIVYSEVGAYFADQRSVEETMRLIQSRVSIYMAEQS